MQAVVLVVTVHVVLLSMRLVVSTCIIDFVGIDDGTIVVVVDRGGIIFLSTIKAFFGDAAVGIVICLHFFLLHIVILSVVSVVIVVEIGIIGVVTEAIIATSALVVLAMFILEIDAGTGNHCDIFWNGRDRLVLGENRSVQKFDILFCRIYSMGNEALFFSGFGGLFALA